jgi:hypothetical protein
LEQPVPDKETDPYGAPTTVRDGLPATGQRTATKLAQRGDIDDLAARRR